MAGAFPACVEMRAVSSSAGPGAAVSFALHDIRNRIKATEMALFAGSLFFTENFPDKWMRVHKRQATPFSSPRDSLMGPKRELPT